MNASQVPQPSGEPTAGRDTGWEPGEPGRTGAETALWNEALPWVDDVSGAEGGTAPPPGGPLSGPVRAPASGAAAARPRPRRKGPMAVGAALVGTGVIAVAAVLVTQHGEARTDAAPAVQAEDDGPARGSSHASPPRTPSSPGRRPSGSAGPTPAGSRGTRPTTPSPGSTPVTVGHRVPSPGPRSAPPPAHSPTPTATATTVRKPYVVQATAVLNPGQSFAGDGATLAMTRDGDLVVTDERGVTRWAAHTSGSDLQTVFQDDGCMAVYDPQGTVHWSSYTNGHPGAVLVITPDGNVQIKLGDTVLWQTGTGH